MIKNIFFIVAILVVAGWVLSGCLSYQGFVKVDDLNTQIRALDLQAQKKIVLAKAGKLSTKEALEFLGYATVEIGRIKTQIQNVRKTDNTGWVGLVVASLASILGATGWVRAWRGPTHKNSKFPV